jgi:SlyX protein
MEQKELEDMLSSLEIKLSYQEATIAELNEIVASHTKEIGIMENHILLLKKKVEALEEVGGGEDLPSRKPPHY